MQSEKRSRAFTSQYPLALWHLYRNACPTLLISCRSFDLWSALICTWAQYPWEITHHWRTLIRFILISVSVLGIITMSLFSTLRSRCRLFSLLQSSNGLTELGDLFPPFLCISCPQKPNLIRVHCVARRAECQHASFHSLIASHGLLAVARLIMHCLLT